MLVVDASVALKWFREEPGSKEALGLLEHQELMLAPATIMLECHNTMAKLFLRQQVAHRQLVDIVTELKRLVSIQEVDEILAEKASIISLVPSPGSGGSPASLRPFNIYDCLYVILALDWDAELVTADQEKARVAKVHGCRVRLI